MKVLALDLSLTSTGVCFPDGIAGRLRTSASGLDRLIELRDRCVRAATGAPDDDGMPTNAADVVVIEGYSMGGQRGSAGVGQALGELGGVVRVALHEAGFPIVDIPPASLKKFATGKGNASKEEVLVAAVKRLGYDGSSNDEADAMWLRAMALEYYDAGIVAVPQANLQALDKVQWPKLDLAVA